MKKTILSVISCLSISLNSYALEPLYDTELQSIDGQAGADLNLLLSLNHTPQRGGNASSNTNILAFNPEVTPQFDTSYCTANKLEYCRLAIGINNRSVDLSTVNGQQVQTSRGDNNGHKQWVVLKGIQGTIHIPKLGLDGTDISYGSITNKAALLFSFDPKAPIKIRNLGFQSISLETDSLAAEALGNVAGYLKADKYTAAEGAFDANNPVTGTAREKGFLGVNMNTNLSIAGTIKMFSCAPSGDPMGHPRC